MKVFTDEFIKEIAAEDPHPWFNITDALSFIGLVILTIIGQVAMNLYPAGGMELEVYLTKVLGSGLAAQNSLIMVLYKIFPLVLVGAFVFLWINPVVRIFIAFLIISAKREAEQRGIKVDQK